MARTTSLENALKGILDELDALKPDSELMLRCTVGELAVMAGMFGQGVTVTNVEDVHMLD